MKKYFYLIIIVLISSLVLTGCLLSNVGQVPATEQSGISYLTKNPGSPDLVGLWHFDTDANDSTANHNDGTLKGNAYFTTGNFDNAVSLDGSGDYVEVPDSTFLRPSNVTVECWVKSSTIKSYQYIVAKYYAGGNASYGLYTGSSTGLFFYVSDGGYALSNDAGTRVWDGNWHHIAGTYDGSTLRLYVDGSEVGTEKSVTKTIGYNTGNLYVGSYGAGYYFTGLIDEVRIWSSALTAGQLNDMTPPTLSKALSGTPGLADWYTSNVTVTLTGDDPTPGSGLNRVEYSFDGTTWTTYTVPFTISTEGTTTLYHQAYDNAGNVYILPSQEIKIDKTLPVVTVALPGTGVYLLGEVVSAAWSATDPTPGSGLATASSGTIPIDTISVGTKTLTVPAGTAVDNAGNPSSVVQVPYNVIYGFLGLLPPYVVPPKAFKIGSSIPLKWQYTDFDGNVVDSVDAKPEVKYQFVDGGNSDGALVFTDDPGSSGLRYDNTIEIWQWQFNWQTKGLPPGLYNIQITSLQTGQIKLFPIQLR
jgi:hypothetical protein